MSIATPHEIIVVIGAGSIGQAIARRIGVGKTILLADLDEDAAKAAADAMSVAGFETSTAQVDVASHESVRALADSASQLGSVVHVVHTAGLSPAQAAPRRSSPSTSSASPMCWRSSAKSSPQADPASSSPAKPATCSPHCRRSRTRPWPTPRPPT